MGKLITIGVIVVTLVVYGHYVVQMQEQALQSLSVIQYQYAHADAMAAHMR